MSEMRIALEVRLYEDVLYWLHNEYAAVPDHAELGEASALKKLIRRLEANAYEVTWRRK